MSNIIGVILAVVGGGIGALGTLMALVMLLAGGANSTPAQLTSIKRWMLAWGVIGVASLVGCVWLLQARRPMTAAGVGVFPMLAVIAVFLWIEFTKG